MQISIPFAIEDLKINAIGTLNPCHLLAEHCSVMFHYRKAHALAINYSLPQMVSPICLDFFAALCT